jgi:hypothetical protein
MRRMTIAIDDDLVGAIEVYSERQGVLPTLTSIVQAALREYLVRHDYVPPPKPFCITPAKKGSGRHDVSVRHNR